MGILQIKQTSSRGQSKVWKLDPKHKRYTLGSSRKADLATIDPMHGPYQAVVEYHNGQWLFIQFERDCKTPCVEINHGFEYRFANSTLQFKIIEKPDFVTQQLHAIQTSGPLQRKIILVSRGSKILKTEVTHVDTPFHYSINGTKHKVDFKNTPEWDHHTIEDFNFRSKVIHVEDLKGIAKLSGDQVVDKEGKKMLYATLFSVVLLLTLGLFMGKPQMMVEAPVAIPAQNIAIKMDKKEREARKARHKAQAQAQEKQKTVSAKNDNSPTPQTAAASNNKVSALLKGAIGARISQLMGKVSATDARTSNVIATAQGIKAGEAASGRALAALGKTDTSGRDWNGEAVGSSSGKVNTAGIAGGKGSANLGSGLAAGKTGAGGVGLLEDESEVEGGLDREVIAAYIKSQLGHILNCYERQLSAHPELHGKVSVKFTISGTGQVVTQNIVETEMKNKPTESCMLSKVAQWKFPEPKGGTKVLVTYPFMFKSTN